MTDGENRTLQTILDRLTDTRETVIRMEGGVQLISARLDDHIDHHEDTRQIVTDELSKCQKAHRPAAISGRAVAAIITAACLGLSGIIAALMEAL